MRVVPRNGAEGGGCNGLLVIRKGSITLPMLPSVSPINVSVICTVALPVKKVNLNVSPSMSENNMIRKIALSVYGPKGGLDGVPCNPRTVVPTNPVNVPDVCSTPLRETRAVKVMELA